MAVAPQLTADNLESIRNAGFKSIICNRPDGEGEGQPAFAEIETAAKAANIDIRYIPVIPGQVTAEQLNEFAAALQEMQGPILAYCKTGGRCEAMWRATRSD